MVAIGARRANGKTRATAKCDGMGRLWDIGNVLVQNDGFEEFVFTPWLLGKLSRIVVCSPSRTIHTVTTSAVPEGPFSVSGTGYF